MTKRNCWDIKQCGREHDGIHAKRLGVCPAATDNSCHGQNGGTNAGRYCWRIAGTFCDGEIQGLFATKIETCGYCEVFQAIIREQGTRIVL